LHLHIRLKTVHSKLQFQKDDSNKISSMEIIDFKYDKLVVNFSKKFLGKDLFVKINLAKKTINATRGVVFLKEESIKIDSNPDTRKISGEEIRRMPR
jgi:hypothetical protein